VVFSTAENGMIPAAFTFDNRPIARTLENNPVRIVTPSNWSRLGFLRSGASANRVVVVPHGIDPTIFSPLDESSRAEIRRGLRWDGVVFLTVGAATANKGVNLLLKAFAAVSRKHPRTHLYIKGINDLYESNVRVEETISNLSEDEKRQISGRAHFTGGLGPFTEMARLYRLADAYVCPYLSEGFCLPALEAAACGAPVICTEGGPTDDFVRDEFAMRIRSRMMTVPDCYGEPGWQLEPDLDHLIELMTRVVEQPEIRQRAHIAGPQFVHGNYTWRHAVDRLLPILFS
jgi:glycosyltransferase involved in cell wall biosynthesis